MNLQSLGMLTRPVNHSDGFDPYVLMSHCGNFRFPARSILNEDELSHRVKYSMYPQYRSFYVWLPWKEHYKLIPELLDELSIYPNIDLEMFLEGTFVSGWFVKDDESGAHLEALLSAARINRDAGKDFQSNVECDHRCAEPTADRNLGDTAASPTSGPRRPESHSGKNLPQQFRQLFGVADSLLNLPSTPNTRTQTPFEQLIKTAMNVIDGSPVKPESSKNDNDVTMKITKRL